MRLPHLHRIRAELRTARTVKAFAGAHRRCGAVSCSPTTRTLPSGRRTLRVECDCGEHSEIPVEAWRADEDFLGAALSSPLAIIRTGFDSMVIDRLLDDPEFLRAVRSAIAGRIISVVLSEEVEGQVQVAPYPRNAKLLRIVQDELGVERTLNASRRSDSVLEALKTPGRGGTEDALIAACDGMDVFVTADKRLLKKVIAASEEGLLECEGWELDEFRAFVYGKRGYRLRSPDERWA